VEKMKTKRLKRFYTDAIIESFVTSNDSTVNSYYDTPVDIICFIQPISGNEVFRYGRADEDSTHRMYCPVSVIANYGDKVTQNGVAYKVLFADQPTGISGVNDHKEIVLGLF
jgi:hypothetical protein